MIGNTFQTSALAESPPDAEAAPIEARHLARQMNGRPVLTRVDLSIRAGETVALMGANGAGKTTLLRCLARQLPPTTGEVLWFGRSIRGRGNDSRLAGYAAHETSLYRELSALENLLFAARMQGSPKATDRAAEFLQRINLPARSSQPVGTMSQGMRQRISLARALIHDPPIVVLDEPFSGLDAAGRDWFEEWLTELRGIGRSICFTTHDATQGHRIADRVLELCRGTLKTCP